MNLFIQNLGDKFSQNSRGLKVNAQEYKEHNRLKMYKASNIRPEFRRNMQLKKHGSLVEMMAFNETKITS